MKKIILILSLMVPAWLYSCTGAKPPVPTPADIIEQAHEAFPEAPYVTAPVVKDLLKPAKTKHKVKKHVRPPIPKARPHADQVPVETLPPQQGTICIFPFNLIPTCTPGEAG